MGRHMGDVQNRTENWLLLANTGMVNGCLENPILNCPECSSSKTHLSKPRGILEKRIFALIFLRPFRCEKCDLRFFRWSFANNRNPSWWATR
jgi:hypothetical protein